MIKRSGTAEDIITNNPDCLEHESKKLDEDKHKLLEKMPDPEVAEVTFLGWENSLAFSEHFIPITEKNFRKLKHFMVRRAPFI